jgi:hypothetical protein
MYNVVPLNILIRGFLRRKCSAAVKRAEIKGMAKAPNETSLKQ